MMIEKVMDNSLYYYSLFMEAKTDNGRLEMALRHIIFLIETGMPKEAMATALNALSGKAGDSQQ